MPKVILLIVLMLPIPVLADSALSDPMRPYNTPDKVETRKTSFVLNAIFVSSRRKLAIVNGERVRIGQTIDGAIVKDIQVDHMTLSLGGRSITLSLGERSGTTSGSERNYE